MPLFKRNHHLKKYISYKTRLYKENIFKKAENYLKKQQQQHYFILSQYGMILGLGL